MVVGEDKLKVITQLGDALLSDAAAPGRKVIRQQLTDAKTTWDELSRDITEHCRQCQKRADAVQLLADCFARLNVCLSECENQLKDAENSTVVTADGRREQLKIFKVCRAVTPVAVCDLYCGMHVYRN